MPQLDLTIEQLEAISDTLGFAMALSVLDNKSFILLQEIDEIIEKEMEKYNVG